MSLTHERFGHLGRNTMAYNIKQLFYWPQMFSDIAGHCKTCKKSLKHTKKNPKQCLMQEREVVSVPSERVCVDIVGLFPKAKGGFEYLITYIDVTIRWPEAIPVRKATTVVVIN